MTEKRHPGFARARVHEAVEERGVIGLLPTTLVGSYPQPEWLIDRKRLAARFPPRVRAKELWRVPESYLAEAQEDATIMAIKAQEDAGLDIITDGEIRRESYSNRFATALDGVDLDNPGTALDRSGHPNPVPRVVGPIRRRHAVEVTDLEFLRRHTQRRVKVTVPGPFTMAQQAQIDYYGGSRQLAAMDYAAAVNDEIRDLFNAGADIVQIDEPYMQARPEEARVFGLNALNRALEGISGTTAVHICFGYAAIIHSRPSGYSFLTELAGCGCRQVSVETAQSNLDCAVLSGLPGKKIILGVIDLSNQEIESPELVATRIRRALPYVAASDLIVAPDCGMKYLPREVAFGKLQAMVAGARIVRAQLDREQLQGVNGAVS
jgi:5-methyltetrahydropteroyltriglutamate--homocysteine methyltransferase